MTSAPEPARGPITEDDDRQTAQPRIDHLAGPGTLCLRLRRRLVRRRRVYVGCLQWFLGGIALPLFVYVDYLKAALPAMQKAYQAVLDFAKTRVLPMVSDWIQTLRDQFCLQRTPTPVP